MSNFKKFLSLVLATVMVAGMMVFTAPSAAAYAPTGDYADNIALLNAFDVMLGDGVSFGEKENVTRWQMALFIARIVTGETGNDMWEADESEFFTDVKADHYPGAIDFCAEMGYIKGVGDNKFDPEGNIIYQDALTMLVRLLGYETASTSYPWGYILTARKIMVGTDTLTSEINTNNKTPLLREEVANLLAKAIYVPVLDAKGNPTVALVESGLDAVNLGDGTLVATWNGAIADYATPGVDDKGTEDTADDEDILVYPAYPKYGEVVFKVGSEFVTVKVKNVTKTDELAMNELLGFKASLVDVKGTKLANMNTVTIHDTFKVEANKNVQIDGVKITDIRQYGDADNNLFVASKANLSTKGRVIVCDVKNDGITADDIARFIPFETVKALFPITVAVKASKNWPCGDANLTLYYTPQAPAYTAKVNDVLVVIHPDDQYNEDSKDHNPPEKVVYTFAGKLRGDVIATSATKDDSRTGLDGVAYARNTSLYVHVNGGEVKFGEIFLGNIKTVGNNTFITVAETVEIAKGTATITGIEDGKNVKFGDTSFPVGYGKAIAAVNSWYGNYADGAADIGTFMGKKVNYTTANGAVIDIAEYSEEAEAETFNSPYNKDSLVLVVKQDGKDITVNADNTITVKTFNTATLAYENVKIDQFNGVKLGQLINQLGVEMTANILNKTATKAVELVKAVLGDNSYNVNSSTYFITIAAVANKTDDVYSISTKAEDLAKIKRAVLGSAAGQDKADDNATVNLTFTNYKENSLSNSKYNLGKFDTAKNAWDFTGNYLSVNKNTKYVLIGRNGVSVITGIVPATGDSLTFTESADTIALAMGNDLVVIYSASTKFVDIIDFTTGSTNAPVASNKGDWYTLTWKSDYVDMSVETIDKVAYFTYNFKDLYNLTTGKNEAVSIVSTTYYANPAIDIFGAKWLSGNGNSTVIDSTCKDSDGSLKNGKWGSNNGNSNLYTVWFITEDGAISESSIYSWGLANGYEVGVLTGIVDPKTDKYADQHYLVIENKKLTATETGYNVTDGDETKDTDIVVTYTYKLCNVSDGAKADELFKAAKHDGTTGYQKKARGELVIYKVDENGVAEFIVNFADAYKGTSTTIVDSQAK